MNLVDLVLHLDRHLGPLMAEVGPWAYAVLALVVLCETGLVVTPFLPGDSLLFAAGAMAAVGGLDIHLLALALFAAAVAGDALNYHVGRRWGRQVAARWVRPERLATTEAFFQRHGGKAIVLARFAPLVRTFAPFVAGCGRMPYAAFARYNVLGAALWVGGFVYAGYLFGHAPVVQEHFSIVVLGIVVVSLLPMLVAALRRRPAPAPTP